MLDFAGWLEQQGVDPASMDPDALSSWRPQYDAWVKTQGGGSQGGGDGGGGAATTGYDPNKLREAWIASGGRTAADLKAFIAAHPEFATGVTIGGSKFNKLYGPGGEYLADVIQGTSGPNPQAAWDTSTGSSTNSTAGADWFAANAPGAAPFTETYTTPERPAAIASPYVAPTWAGGDFAAPQKPASLEQEFRPPTMAEVEASPGYQTRFAAGQQALERSAAARGSILSGGTQKATARYGQDYAANEYGNEFARRLQGRQQTAGEYQTDFGNAYQTYQQRYGQFMDAANLGAQGRQINESAYGSDVTNSRNQYNTRYGAYQDAIRNNFDYARLGLDATLGGRP